MREEGYYWVKYEGGWAVGFHNPEAKAWWIGYFDKTFEESDFEEIDENRIERGSIGIPNPKAKIDWVKAEEYDELRERLLIQRDRDIYGQSFEMLKDGKVYRVDPTTIKHEWIKNEIKVGVSPVAITEVSPVIIKIEGPSSPMIPGNHIAYEVKNKADDIDYTKEQCY